MENLDECCQRFEDAWRAGDHPSIEDYMSPWADRKFESASLLRELLLIEWDQRASDGEDIDIAEYCRRFPDHERFILAAAREFQETSVGRSTVCSGKMLNAGGESADWKATGLDMTGHLDNISLHAVGGLGEVHVAEDRSLHRKVAIKRIRPKHQGNPDGVRRFQLEAEITGRMEHPGIVPVHGVGKDSADQPFYVMKFIQGETFENCIKQFHKSSVKGAKRSLEFRNLLNHFVQSCNAFAYAHSRGVIHRDIKPANIMLGKYREMLVVDWGLARVMDSESVPSVSANESLFATKGSDDSSKTALGQAIGTPAFMSPEQADGRHDIIDHRSDIYSLGVTLYYLLTGQKPFRGSVETVIAQVRRGEFQRPRAVRRDVPRALEAVCLKAMSLHADQRYEDVSALSSDIEAYLDDQAVAAWAEPFWVAAQRWLRKHLNLVLTFMLLLTIVATVMVLRAYAGERDNSEKLSQMQARLRHEAQLASRVSLLFSGLRLEGSPTGLLGIDHRSADLSQVAEEVSRELKGSPEVRRRLYDTIGEHFTVTGNLVEGERYLSQAMELHDQSDDSVDRARTLHRLAFLRANQGRITEARNLARDAIGMRSRVYGENDLRTLASKSLYLFASFDTAEFRDQRIVIPATPRYINAWQEILNAKLTATTNGESDPDVASIELIQAGLFGNWALMGSNPDSWEYWQRIGQAVSLYTKAKSSAEVRSNHPVSLLSKIIESALMKPLAERFGFTQESILADAEELSGVVFYGNRSHPGALIVKWRVLSQLPWDEKNEETLLRVYQDAQRVFAGQPRAGEFTRELAEILDLWVRGNDQTKRISVKQLERLTFEAQRYALLAIDQLADYQSEKGWQIGEAHKTLARIAQRSGQSDEAERQYRLALKSYDLGGVRGYRYFDRQARGQLAELLDSLGRDQEASALRTENDEALKELTNRIPQIIERLFDAVPELGVGLAP